MNFINTFTQVLILFILILIGYFIRYRNLIDKSFTSKLSNLVLSIFLPALIINSMQINFEPSIINKIIIIILLSFITYLISYLIAYSLKFIFKSDKDIGVYQYAVMFSNVGFMGYPVVQSIFGSDALFYASIFNLPFNLLIMTLGVYLLCRGNKNYDFSIKSFVNPVIVSILIGFILFIFRIKLPIFINDTLELLGDLTTPLSMLIIGSMLCESPAKECFFNKKLYLIVFIRLLFIPACIYFILKGIVNDKLLLSIPVILTSMPIATNAAIMANKYKANESLASQLVFLSALLSIITIPFISFLFIR